MSGCRPSFWPSLRVSVFTSVYVCTSVCMAAFRLCGRLSVCPSLRLSVCMSGCRTSFWPSLRVSVYTPTVCTVCMCGGRPSFWPSLPVSICTSVRRPSFGPSGCLVVWPSGRLSVCLSVDLSMNLSRLLMLIGVSTSFCLPNRFQAYLSNHRCTLYTKGLEPCYFMRVTA